MTTQVDLDAVLRGLAGKYAVEVPPHWRVARTAEGLGQGRGDSPASPHPLPLSPERERGAAMELCYLVPGCSLLGVPMDGTCIPLLPWRNERRFVELKRLVDSRTVEPVSMCRFACTSSGAPMGLDAILYREFDLAEWLLGSPITTLHASVTAGRAANAVVRLASGVVCSIEASTTLPAGSRPDILDRHELIAQRGVASDRVVDTQVPQSSIYTFTGQGSERFTDTDAELFGLEADDVNLVRAAYELAAEPGRKDALLAQHERLAALVQLAHQSDRERQCLAVKGGRP